jgi:hypothetical protein
MTTDDKVSQAPDEDGDRSGRARWHAWGRALQASSLRQEVQGAPLWMRTELVRLRAAFPEFSFGICPGWRGLAFEAWCDPRAGGLYAVITQDAGELRHELEESRDGLRRVTNACGKEVR